MFSTIVCILLLVAIGYFAFAVISDLIISLYARMGGLYRPVTRASKRNLSLL